MKHLKFLLPIILMAPGSLWAEQGDLPHRTRGFYLGLGGGLSAIEMQAGAIMVDGDDLATKLMVGYRIRNDFSRLRINLAFEGGYTDLGTVTDNSLGATVDLSVDGLNFHTIAFFPIMSRWDIFGKAGVYTWNADLRVDGVHQSDDDGTDIAGGFGASFNTGTALGFRLEVESFDMLDGAWATTISGIYQFK